MDRPFRQTRWEKSGDVFCVHLANSKLDETGLEELGAEIARLIDELGCRKMVLNLGPEDPQCLYSVFLAKLVTLHRRLQERGGAMVLAQLSPTSLDIFEAAGLQRFFAIYPDQDAAIAALSA